MAVTVDRDQSRWLIHIEGDISLASAAELKSLLLEGLASSKELWLDLERAREIDITLLQLLWAASRETVSRSAAIVSQVSEAAAMASRDAGFEKFPGSAIQE